MQFIYHPGKRWEKERGQYKKKKAVQVQVTIYSQRRIKYCM